MRVTRTLPAMVIGAGLLGALAPAGALGATTVGQSPPLAGTPAVSCSSGGVFADVVQVSSTTGPSYVVPAGGGVITGWRVGLTAGTGQAKLRLFSPVSTTAVTPVAESAVETILANSALPPFQTRITAAGGEALGFSFNGDNTTAGCANIGVTASDVIAAGPAQNIGVSEAVAPAANILANVSAILEPDADKDGFGDESQDALFTKTPKKKTDSRKANFGFTGAASFACSLDKRAFAPCTSPVRLKRLKPRKHTFRVHAVTPKGELSPDTRFRWRVKR